MNIILLSTGSIKVPSSVSFLAGQESQPFAISIPNPTPNRVDLHLFAPGITFNPPTVTFVPDQGAVTVVASGGAIGNTATVFTWVSGPEAAWFSAPSFPITVDFSNPPSPLPHPPFPFPHSPSPFTLPKSAHFNYFQPNCPPLKLQLLYSPNFNKDDMQSARMKIITHN